MSTQGLNCQSRRSERGPIRATVHKDNDILADAAPAVSGTGLGVFLEDDDFFRFVVPAGATVDANVLFTDIDGDLDARLLDGSGNTLVSGTTTTDNEIMSWSNTTGSDAVVVLQVFVWPFSAEPCNAYDWNLSITP